MINSFVSLFRLQSIRQNFVPILLLLFSNLVHFLYSIISRSIVSPQTFGVFTGINIFLTYFNFLQLGSVNSFNRNYPSLIGEGKTKEASIIKNSLISILFSIYFLLIVIIFSLRSILGLEFSTYLIILLFSSYLFYLDSVGQVVTRTYKNEVLTSVSVLVKYLIGSIISLMLILRYSLVGLFLMMPISSLIGVLFLLKYTFIEFRLSFNFKIFIELSKKGSGLLLLSFISTLVFTLDKVLISLYLNDSRLLAYYSIGTLAFSLVTLIPQLLTNITYVALNLETSLDKNYINLKRKTISVFYSNLFLSIATAIFLYFLFPVFIRFFLPNYSYGIISSQILLLAGLPLAFSLSFSSSLTIINKEHKLIKVNIFMLIINLLISYIFIILNLYSIELAAISTLIAYSIYFFYVMHIFLKFFNRNNSLYN